jgi:hypothetical protein
MNGLRSGIQDYLQRTAPPQVPPNKAGMVHTPPETGFLPKMPNPGFGYSGSLDAQRAMQGQRQGALNDLPSPGQPAPAGPQTTATDMIAEQNQAFAPEQVAPGIYRDQDTNSYADSAAGTQEGAFTRTGQMGIPRTGGVASTNLNGPFGRSPEEQTAIENRVGQIQRATDFIRSMRDIPTEREKLQRQAGQYVSLNQGLGSFLNQGSQRNYARERLSELDKNKLSEDKLEAENIQNQFDNRIALNNMQKGVFAPTYYEDQEGNRTPAGLNTITGDVSAPQAPAKTYTPQEARDEATSIVDKILSERKGFFDTEEDVLGMTREKAIEQEMAKLAGNQQGQAQNYSQEDLEFTAKENGMTVDEVKAKLGVK